MRSTPAQELEQQLGDAVRGRRIGGRLTQAELAERANVSLGALKHLEAGKGSTVTTLVKVMRALGDERWIERLGPAPESFNPLDLLEARRRTTSGTGRRRVRHPRDVP